MLTSPRTVIDYSLLFGIALSASLLLASIDARAAAPTAEPARTTGDITGSVSICPALGVDTVLVHVPGRSFSAHSAADGSFTINFVAPGIYDLSFKSDGAVLSSLSNVVVESKQVSDLGQVSVCVDADGDGFDATVDCNDADPAINPGASEACNAIDDNCDGSIDEGLPTQTFYRDADNDGFGDPANPMDACSQPSGFVTDSQDCFDANSSARPNQLAFFEAERGDGSFDYNCDGVESLGDTDLGNCEFASGCSLTQGWDGAVPDCGDLGTQILSCSISIGSCNQSDVGQNQACN